MRTLWTLVAQRPIISTTVFLAKLSTEFTPFRRAHAAPPLPHLLASLRWQRAKPLTGITDGLPLFRRKLAKPLEALAEALLLIWCQLLPLLESLVSLLTFLGIHILPLTRPVQKPLLSFRRQLIPGSAESLKELLLVLA